MTSFERALSLFFTGALVFFGAVLGDLAAQFFEWVELTPDRPNVLPGVIAAIMGSALAALGAVVVQRLEAKERHAVSCTFLFLDRLELLRADLAILRLQAARLAKDRASANRPRVQRLVEGMETLGKSFKELPVFSELSRQMNRSILIMKARAKTDLMDAATELRSGTSGSGVRVLGVLNRLDRQLASLAQWAHWQSP